MSEIFNIAVSDLVDHWKLIQGEGESPEDYFRPVYLSPAMYKEAMRLDSMAYCSTCGKLYHFGPCYDTQKWMQDEIKPLSNWKYLVFGGEG